MRSPLATPPTAYLSRTAVHSPLTSSSSAPASSAVCKTSSSRSSDLKWWRDGASEVSLKVCGVADQGGFDGDAVGDIRSEEGGSEWGAW